MANMKDIGIKAGILILIVVVIVLLHKYVTSSRSMQSTEKFLMGAPIDASAGAPVDQNNQGKDTIVASESGNGNDEQYKRVDNLYSAPFPRDCYPRDKLLPSDLMPSGDAINSEFAQMNPMGQGDLANKNFLTAGFHVGIDTQGSSLRNANLSIRSEPPNPRIVVGPWNQSTIDPDLMRRPFEIGGDGCL